MSVNSNIRRLTSFFIISALGLCLLLLFSQPNRLSHDEIMHRWYMTAEDNPKTFVGDYLLGTDKYKLEQNYFSYGFYKFVGKLVDPAWPNGGGDELSRWVIVPFVFIIFSFGMFELIYFFTKMFWISLFTALISNVHISPIFVAEWGLPGPTGIDPWTFIFAFYPLLFLSFYRGVKENRELLVFMSFAGAGILGNLHILTTFYLLGTFALTYLFLKKISVHNLLRMSAYGVSSIILNLPYLVKFYSAKIIHTTAFNPNNRDIYEAVRQTAFHVTAAGRLLTVRQWLFYHWQYTLVGFALLILVVFLAQKTSNSEQKYFGKFALIFIGSALLFNGAFSALQLTRFYALHNLPMFNEPRGVQLIYILFFVSLALLLAFVTQSIRPYTSKHKTAMLTGLGLLIAAGMFTVLPKITAFSKIKTEQRYLFLTCDAEMYRRLSHVLKPGDIILVDPGQYSAMRICTKHPVVVQSRDRGPAYDQGSDVLLEWYNRFNDVSKAFRTGGENLINIAKNYNARVIVSRDCVAVPREQLLLSEKILNPTLGHEGCIYTWR